MYRIFSFIFCFFDVKKDITTRKKEVYISPVKYILKARCSPVYILKVSIMERTMKFKPLILFIVIILSITAIQPIGSVPKSKNPAKILFVISDFNIFEDEAGDNSEIYCFDLNKLKRPQAVVSCQAAISSYISNTQLSINRFLKYSPWSKGTFS